MSGQVLAHFQASYTASTSASKSTISPLARTAELAIATVHGIIQKTRKHALNLAFRKYGPDGSEEFLHKWSTSSETDDEKLARNSLMELRLVQSQEEILRPKIQYFAQVLKDDD